MNVLKTELNIGLPQPLRILQVSDCHLSACCEEDSDKVVDSLLAYEAQLAADFKAAAAVHLKKLAELLKDYKAEVQDTENTLTSWQRDIHANYNTRGGSTYYDEFTGQHTHRSPRPVPVHQMPYTGCDEAHRMEGYLEKDAALYREG